ncbi:MAG: SDR family NAD(P)-dependent oxidoreductase [Bacteroidota bacterium]|nr:SDR family NAD(P)-dependent oxidoreductase [Bacteroidota bacterium]
MKNKTVLITGASSGIGWETAKKFSNSGAKVILCGRRKNKLLELEKEISNPSHIMVFDVRNRENVEKEITSIPNEFSNIDILINNAGNAHGLDNSDEANLDDWDLMIDTNLKGLIYVTKAVLPKMIAAGKGHIINVGSIAGKEVYPKGNVYCASKFGVNAFNKGLRIDLNEIGIKVGIINPGKVKTEFSEVRFKGDSDKAKKVYEGLKVLSPQDIADAIFYMASTPYHVNISELEILPNSEANTYIFNRNL